MNEFRRILFSRRTLLFLFVAILLGMIFFLYDCNSDKAITITDDALFEYIDSYPKFLASVRNNADNYNTLAVLQSGFSAENIRKTVNDYEKLLNVRPQFGENKGFVLLSSYLTGDIVIIVVTLLIATVFSQERKKGLTTLIRSTKNGRKLLSFQRCLVIIITAMSASFFMHLTCFIVAQFCCGDMEVLRPIQSVPEFSLCPYSITIMDYLIYSIFIKALVASIYGLFLYLISSVMESVISFGLCGIGLIVEYLLYIMILPTDRLAVLKFCNIVALLRTDLFFNEYCNLNIFGNAVHFFTCAFITTSVLFVTLFLLCIIFTSSRITEWNFGTKLLQTISEFISKKSPSLSLPLWEVKKIFIHQKGIIVLAVVLYVAISSAFQYRYLTPIYTDIEETYYIKYSGEINAKLHEDMTLEYENIQETYEILNEIYWSRIEQYGFSDDSEELEELYEKLQTLEYKLAVLELFIDKVENGLEYTSKTGITIQLIKQELYELLLLNDTATTKKNALYIMIAMVGIFAGIYANENHCNMRSTLKTSPKGRGKLTAIKLFIIAFMSILVTLTIYAPQILLIGIEGYNDLDATAQSLTFLRFVPFPITILGYLILMFVIRIIATFIVGIVVMLISNYCHNAITAVCISAAIIIIPAVLSGTELLPIPSIADLIGYCVVQ